MSPRWRTSVALVAAALFLTDNAQAQPKARLVDMLPTVYDRSLGTAFLDVQDPGEFLVADEGGFDFGGFIVSAIVSELGSFPIGSSSSGFTYSTDKTTLLPTRTSESFGPAFAERPQTIGRDRSSVGITFIHRRYDYLEGRNLSREEVISRGSVLARRTFEEVGGFFSSYTVTIDSYTTTLFATYGVTDNVDLSLAIPFQQVDMAATVRTWITAAGPTPAAAYNSVLAERVAEGSASDSGSATGLGDLAIRGKYNLFSNPSARRAVAVGVDLRVPTGNEDQLLGTGNTRFKIYGALASQLGGVLSPHLNVGYTFRSGESEGPGSNFYFGSEFSYAAGAELALSPRLTFVGDFIGRRLSDEGRLRDSEMYLDVLDFYPGETVSLLLGTAGVKFNLGSTFIFSAHLLFPLNDVGLQSRLTAVVGGDFTFGSRSAGSRP